MRIINKSFQNNLQRHVQIFEKEKNSLAKRAKRQKYDSMQNNSSWEVDGCTLGQQKFNTEFTTSCHCTLSCTTWIQSTYPLQPYTTFVLCGIFRRKECFINPHCTVLLYYYHRVSIQLQLTNISISIPTSKKSSFHLSSDRPIFLLRMCLKPVLKPVKVYGTDSKVLVSDYVSEHRRSSRTVLCMAEE
jgi:hypothetical protein